MRNSSCSFNFLDHIFFSKDFELIVNKIGLSTECELFSCLLRQFVKLLDVWYLMQFHAISTRVQHFSALILVVVWFL